MVENVKKFKLHVTSTIVALFASKKASFEIPTDELINDCLKSGKDVYLPRCITKSRELEYIQITDLTQDIEIGVYSIREPKKELELKPQDLVFRNFDVVYVPGVAFDVFGNRLGFGSGYYDNFLKTLRKFQPDIPVIALAFDFQVFNFEIPHNAKDEIVDYIITSSAIFKMNN
jgi:5-formyltetrahydrofolate cyclo-ligase